MKIALPLPGTTIQHHAGPVLLRIATTHQPATDVECGVGDIPWTIYICSGRELDFPIDQARLAAWLAEAG